MSLKMVVSLADDTREQTSPKSDESAAGKKPYAIPVLRRLSEEEVRDMFEKHGINLDEFLKR